jgi:plasmid stabilization system protein ParE
MMKLVYMSTALPDIAWMRHYYRSVFPQGRREALGQLGRVERLIQENPDIGKVFGNAREFPIPRTPFSVIYRKKSETIEVVRIWDQRRDPVDLSF